MERHVQSELLDDLSPWDAEATASRLDLRRLNRIMGHPGILSRALLNHSAKVPFPNRRLTVVELGAGDGTLMLQLAQKWSRSGIRAQLTSIDRQPSTSTDTLGAYAAIGWSAVSVASEVNSWLKNSSEIADVMISNLFLHHFEDAQLRVLLASVAVRSRFFMACEPRRTRFSRLAARGLWMLGCNRVTRHDARVSVDAGFRNSEISKLWPANPRWKWVEHSAGLFSHCFIASRHP